MQATLSIQQVPMGRSLIWLKRGAQDFAARPLASLSYGVLLALTGFLIVALAGRYPHLLTASISGFFLAGPFLGIGLYRLSQAREAGEQITLWDSLTAWRKNPWSIGMFGVLLAFILLSWERISAILFALFHGAGLPTVSGGWTDSLFIAADPAFLMVYLVAGAILAAIVFSLSVIALPMLLTGPIDPVTAAIASVTAVRKNTPALLIWALIIVALITLGMMTAFIGLIVIMPLVAHATWHAYRDLTKED
ncbi:DUF2189 domain-containing protein [Spiribacter sp. C176]|uniref:DUF2189 domain-containing protein n=1 Tax=Spiribacter salilacus TaxID=2664894 RepID=A0A6N7QLG0_9GAMM|nr:DUF2189 domain-containing protein [Spiribacter salilacus]MRH77325.1 DUF2189 domain-containing protein [Spiribacter salilacus]